MRRIHRLSPLKISQLKVAGRYADGGGLELQISKSGTKAWLFRYVFRGREHRMGLGPIGTINLAEARVRARALRQQLLDGVDPLSAKRKARSDMSAQKTFREVADAFLKAKLRDFRSVKHREQWASTLDHAHRVLGDLPVNDIRTDDVLRVLRPLHDRVPETARRLRGRIERVIAYAIGSGHRVDQSNPARWQGHLKDLFPAKPPVKHLSLVPYAELPELSLMSANDPKRTSQSD